MGVKSLINRVHRIERGKSKGRALLDWLDESEAALPGEVQAGRLSDELSLVYARLREWARAGLVR